MEIVIVAKTHMKNAACVGGFEIQTGKNVRLLNTGAENQPKDTDFEVGQVWDIDYTDRPTLIAPHIEDVMITRKKFLRLQNNMAAFLLQRVNVWNGSPENIFERKVIFSTGHSGFLSNPASLPGQSVGFWQPEENLELSILNDRRHFFYFDQAHGCRIYCFPYTGFQPVIEQIPAGTLVRLSLARWWSPTSSNDKKCYCQISGWYN